MGLGFDIFSFHVCFRPRPLFPEKGELGKNELVFSAFIVVIV